LSHPLERSTNKIYVTGKSTMDDEGRVLSIVCVKRRLKTQDSIQDALRNTSESRRGWR
jgi:hypothetical protein